MANCKFGRTANKTATFWKIGGHSSSFCSDAFSTFHNICYTTGKPNSDSLRRVRQNSRSVNELNQFQGDRVSGSGRTCHSRHRHCCVTCHASDCWLQTSESKHGVRSGRFRVINTKWREPVYVQLFIYLFLTKIKNKNKLKKAKSEPVCVCDSFKLCQVSVR